MSCCFYIALIPCIVVVVILLVTVSYEVYLTFSMKKALEAALIASPVVLAHNQLSQTLPLQFDLLLRLQTAARTREPPQPPKGMRTEQLVGERYNAWVVSDADTTWVVFRGTATRREWRNNVDVSQVPFLTGRVHAGFYKMYVALVPQLHNVKHPVKVAGHSLGAALAQMYALETSGAELFAYASPRVGDAAFASLVNSLPGEIVLNKSDVVTDLPLAVHPNRFGNKPFLYAHPSSATYFDVNRGSWKINHDLLTYAFKQ